MLGTTDDSSRPHGARPGREPLTGMCTVCGQVFWVDEGHSCPGAGRTRAALRSTAAGVPARAALRLAA